MKRLAITTPTKQKLSIWHSNKDWLEARALFVSAGPAPRDLTDSSGRRLGADACGYPLRLVAHATPAKPISINA